MALTNDNIWGVCDCWGSWSVLDGQRLGIEGWRSRGVFTTGSDQPPQFTLFGTHQPGVRGRDFVVVTE